MRRGAIKTKGMSGRAKREGDAHLEESALGGEGRVTDVVWCLAELGARAAHEAGDVEDARGCRRACRGLHRGRRRAI